MKNLKGRKYSRGNRCAFYHAPENTNFMVMEIGSRDVVSEFDNREDASSAMVVASLDKDSGHCLIAEEPKNETLIVLEKF